MAAPAWTPEQITAILAVFDDRTRAGGRRLAESGSMSTPDWDDPTLTATTSDNRHHVSVTVTWDGGLPAVTARCDCPIAVRCMHCAAAVIAATSTASRPSVHRTSSQMSVETRPLSRWRTLVDEVVDSVDEDSGPVVVGPELPLALQFAVVAPPFTDPELRIRPATHGPGGAWSTKAITWQRVQTGTVTERHPRTALDALTRLARLLVDSETGPILPDDVPLTQAPAAVWGAFDDLRAAGVVFVPGPGTSVEKVAYGERIETCLRVEAAGSSLRVLTDIAIDTAPVPSTGDRHLIGRPRVHGVAQAVDGVLHLGALPQLTATESMMLLSGAPLEVGEDEIDEFRTAVDSLRKGRTVVVEPGTFPSETVTGPFPVLHIDAGGNTDGTVTARWSIGYEVDGDAQEFVPQSPTVENFRRTTAERAAWESVRAELEMVARSSSHWVADAADRLAADLPKLRADFRRYNRMYAVLRQLRGRCTVSAAFDSAPDYRTIPVALSPIEAAVLCAETVPQITELGRVRVEIDGEVPDYRPAESTPVIRFSSESANDGANDWFDLRVALDVDGHRIPITTVISALASGETHMVLDDGTFFSLEIPQLTTLQERLREAREMGEMNGDHVSRHSLNASLWDELLELGVVDDQLIGWRERMARLAAARPPEPVAPSPGLVADLRPYQQEGLNWLTFLWDNSIGGVLADDMGLGKTVQTLALIRRVLDEQPDARFLVVAPTSVISNWAGEIHRFTPDVPVVTATATQKRVGSTLAERAADARIVITSYALLRIDYDAFASVQWAGVVFDEAQFLKNHNAKTHKAARRLPAEVKLAITGTPMENRVMELWSLVSVVAPGLYSSPQVFKDHFAGPIESGQAPERLEVLRRRLRPIMLRRTKDQVLTDLPAKQEQVLHLDLDAKHQKVYDTYLARDRQQLLGLIDDFDNNRIQILRALTRLRQLSLHPVLVDAEHRALTSAKIEYLSEQLPTLIDEGHSALVFSSFTGFLRLVADQLDTDGIAYSYLDGSTPVGKRGEAIEQFTAGGTQVFLISLKAGGFGLNLTAADYCFMTDPWWNPAAESQAVDRAHRIGQQRAVSVYRLVSAGTIEEKVIDLQNRKRELFEALIDDGDAFSGSITADDVRSLFE